MNIPVRDLHKLIWLACLNKVDLEVIKRLHLEHLFPDFLNKHRRVMSVIAEIGRFPVKSGYALFKFLKPFLYVPSDIDILALPNISVKLAKYLVKSGFRIVVAEPYCITLRRRDNTVDIYVHPAIGGSLCYLDGKKLLEHTQWIDVEGVKIPCLEAYAEVVVTCAHAVYKEHIITLGDILTYLHWYNEKTLQLAEELNCTDAIRVVSTVTELVQKGELILPCKIKLTYWAKLLLHKIREDKLTRSTLVYMLSKLSDRRTVSLLKSHLTRISY